MDGDSADTLPLFPSDFRGTSWSSQSVATAEISPFTHEKSGRFLGITLIVDLLTRFRELRVVSLLAVATKSSFHADNNGGLNE